MHYYMLHQIHRRAADGIHWNAEAVRMQVNVFLTHFCLSRKIPLLNRWKKSRNLEMKENCLLEEAKLALKAASTDYLNRQRNRKRLQKRTFAQAHRRRPYQGYRNRRYNLINWSSSSCGLCEINKGLWFDASFQLTKPFQDFWTAAWCSKMVVAVWSGTFFSKHIFVSTTDKIIPVSIALNIIADFLKNLRPWPWPRHTKG